MKLISDQFLNSEKYQSFNRELKIPSLQQSLFLKECNREITFIRDDQIHPVISGNKWRKLKFHLENYVQRKLQGISSMGGAFSNHLHALAFVCNELNIPCTLFVYGWNGELNSPTLVDCLKWNADLQPITRQQAAIYCIQEADATVNRNYYWIPEGGGGTLGEQGMKELVDELPFDFDVEENCIVCASGTGTSIQGILNHTRFCKVATQQIVKMANYPWINNERILLIQADRPNSFAKKDRGLLEFINDFNNSYEILLDPVYTARLMIAFLKDNGLHSYSKIYFIHTGGLQANRIL